MRSTFLQVLQADEKSLALREAIRDPASPSGARFSVAPDDFSQVPGSPFSYWVSPSIRSLFATSNRVEQPDRIVRQGGVTGDDARFLRTAWELPLSRSSGRSSWVPFAKGGRLSRWYADYAIAVVWDELRGTFFGYTGLLHRPSEKPSSADHYFRPGLTWPLRASRFAPVPLPAGAVFSIRGYALLAAEDCLLAIGAVGNSTPFDYIFKVALGRFGFPEFVVGILQKLPFPDLTPADSDALAALARRAWSLKRSLDTRTETSHAFVLPALLQTTGETLAARSTAWSERVREAEADLSSIQAEIDERCFALYGIGEDDRRAITEGFGGATAGSEVSDSDAEGDADADDEAEAEAAADATTLAAELVVWAVGVAFGRFDIRMATGDRALPAEPEPFDPLPVCSAAMLTGDDGLRLAHPPAGYPLAFPEDGILVDDPGHPRDLTAAVRAVFEIIFGTLADALWQEAAALLDPRGHDLRTWLASDFFGHHLQRHSKSRRKAPILWQLGVPSGRYSVWTDAHRLTRDSLLAIANDVVAPKLATEERRHSSVLAGAGATPAARDRAELAAQEALVEELRILLDELKRVAPLWNPDLDDGIVLVLAPLWRLVQNHRPWQKELKGRWDDLAAGKYDWAHLAMHLWPERVVPKCATDRSLAIAHDLEEVFWAEGVDGKWTRRATPTRPLETLVAERTSPAVKAALADLLAAPGPAGGGGRRSRTARVTA